MAFESFVIAPLEMFEAVIHPAFSDLLPAGQGVYDGVLTEFTLMDNVKSRRPVVDIRQKMNILQRRDASCELNYKKVMGTGVRSIEVSDLYGATKHCQNEFYQGDLRDWRNESDLFGSRILPFFQKAMRTDLAANAWFGDINRVGGGAFSTNVFDGIFKWLLTYSNLGLIAAAQTKQATVGDYRANPGLAFQLIKAVYDAQPVLMDALPDQSKAFYVDKDILAGYQEYVRSLGTSSKELIDLYGKGAMTLDTYNGIPIIVIPLFKPILADIHGDANHHACILTMRGNFVFGTDKTYGEGENDEEALMIWYERKELSWYYNQFLKGGTQIAEPEMVVYAI